MATWPQMQISPVLINYSDREASSETATKGEVNWIAGRKRGLAAEIASTTIARHAKRGNS